MLITQQTELFHLSTRDIQRTIQLHMVQEGNLSYQQMVEDHNELEKKTTRLEEIIAAFESINYSLQFENDSLKRQAQLHENTYCTNCNIRKRKRFFPENDTKQANQQERQNRHEAEEAAAEQLAAYHALVIQEQIYNSNTIQLNEQQTLAVQHQHTDIITDHNNQNM